MKKFNETFSVLFRKLTEVRNRDYFVITGIFFASRLLFWVLGIRFDMGTLNWYNQYIDPALLRKNLLESLIYMHGQPPLYNLFLGIVLKMFNGPSALVFHLVYILFGCGITVLIYSVSTNLKIPKLLAMLLCIGFAISPSEILYENILIYSLPVAFLILLSVYLLLQGMESNSFLFLSAALLSLSVVVGMRSSYHFLLIAFLVVYLIICAGKHLKKNIMIGGIVALIIGLVFPFKNLLIYDRFETSSWLGMSFWHVTTQVLSAGTRQDLAARGDLSPLSATFSFLPLYEYPQEYWVNLNLNCIGPAIICEKTKSNGSTNFNNVAYLRISDVFLKDDIYTVKHYPQLVFKRALSGLIHYVWPASSFDHLENNRVAITEWDNFWNKYIYGRVNAPGRAGADDWSKYAYPLLALWFGAGLLYGLVAVLRSILQHNKKNDSHIIVIGYATIIVIYSATVSNLFDYGENMKYRFEVEPISIILFGYLAMKTWEWAAHSWQRSHANNSRANP